MQSVNKGAFFVTYTIFFISIEDPLFFECYVLLNS